MNEKVSFLMRQESGVRTRRLQEDTVRFVGKRPLFAVLLTTVDNTKQHTNQRSSEPAKQQIARSCNQTKCQSSREAIKEPREVEQATGVYSILLPWKHQTFAIRFSPQAKQAFVRWRINYYRRKRTWCVNLPPPWASCRRRVQQHW